MYRTILPITNRHRSLSDDMLHRHLQYIPGMLEPYNIRALSEEEEKVEPSLAEEEKKIDSSVELVALSSSIVQEYNIEIIDKEIQTDGEKYSMRSMHIIRPVLGCLVIIGGVFGLDELEYVVGGIILCIEIKNRWNRKK